MENIAEVVGFLEVNNLPAQDIQANDSNVDLFQIKHQNRVIGTIGLEMYETVALLRSLAVKQSERNWGSVKSWWTTLKKWQKKEV